MKTYAGVKITFVLVVIFCVASTVRFSMKIGNPYAAEFGETIAEGGGAVRHYTTININSNGSKSENNNSNNNNGTTTTTTTSLRRIKENIKKVKQKEINTNDDDDDDVKIKGKQKEKEKDDDDDDDDSVDEVTQKDDDEEQEQEGEESTEKTNATFLFDTNTSSDNNSFSACIMWMDDNHRLEEWLAYHYYIMKLRYVVIAVDQKSRTSPQHIVDRWNDYDNKYSNLNMTIITWKDSEYISDYKLRMKEIDEAESMSILAHGNEKTRYHRYRQHEFYRMCSTHLLKQNKTWVSYHDTDEFVTFAHSKKPNSTDITEDGIKKMKQPYYFLDLLNDIKKQLPPGTSTHLNDTGLSCLSIQRRRYCSNELNEEETKQLLLSSSSSSSLDSNSNSSNVGIISQNLDTLRYKYLTPGYDGQQKAFIDLSQHNPRAYIHNQYKGKHQKRKWETHRPMLDLCKREEMFRADNINRIIREERLIVNHYLGSWAAYSFRDDARRGGLRSYEAWFERSNYTNGEYSNVIRPWLQGFITLVGGSDIASYLLQDAGKFPKTFNGTERINDYEYKYKLNSRPGQDQTRSRTSGLETKEELEKERKAKMKRKYNKSKKAKKKAS